MSGSRTSIGKQALLQAEVARRVGTTASAISRYEMPEYDCHEAAP
ncbi:MAG: hypothetical protein R3A80_09125 [Bdellovibrionota bacterium]